MKTVTNGLVTTYVSSSTEQKKFGGFFNFSFFEKKQREGDFWELLFNMKRFLAESRKLV